VSPPLPRPAHCCDLCSRGPPQKPHRPPLPPSLCFQCPCHSPLDPCVLVSPKARSVQERSTKPQAALSALEASPGALALGGALGRRLWDPPWGSERQRWCSPAWALSHAARSSAAHMLRLCASRRQSPWLRRHSAPAASSRRQHGCSPARPRTEPAASCLPLSAASSRDSGDRKRDAGKEKPTSVPAAPLPFEGPFDTGPRFPAQGTLRERAAVHP